MKKLLLKIFMPSAEDLAKMAVDAVAKFINESGKTEMIAKYGSYADEFSRVQAKVSSWLVDGKIDDKEKDELYRAVLPLFDKLVKEVCQ